MNTLLDGSFSYSLMVILSHTVIKIIKKKKSDHKSICLKPLQKKGAEVESNNRSLQSMEIAT